MTPLARGRKASVVGTSVIGAFGVDHVSVAAALASPGSARTPELELTQFESRAAVRARKLMSRGARLGALAIARALTDAGWSGELHDVGAFFGVGASGGSMEDLEAMLSQSAGAHGFSLEAFGGPGLLACNPLLAFQLMNNFTLCHGAILAGTGGPNAAFFSRGAGTAFALAEALHALAEGDSERVLVGGADTALHPVTRDELERDGWRGRGLVPSEGAAVLALVRASPGATVVSEVAVGDEPPDRVDAEVVVLAVPDADVRDSLKRKLPNCLDFSVLGEALAATPALAWAHAHWLLAQGRARTAAVVTHGVDGQYTHVRFERREPEGVAS